MNRIDPRTAALLAATLATGLMAAAPAAVAAENPCAAKSQAQGGGNPCAAKAANPCAAKPANPCAAKATGSGAGAGAGANPCAAKPASPGAAKPANPCAPRATNPCAPRATNPCAPRAANPCAANPCAPAAAAKIGDQEAAALYRDLRPALQAAYAAAPLPAAAAYHGWRRFNSVPYVSETHGGRHVNNYADPKAADTYARFDPAARFPVGATLAKDSFRPLPEGGVEPGPLFLMQKMEQGFNAGSGDWRFAMVMPDGSVFGETNGRNADQVAFCAECHAGAGSSFAFYLPEEYKSKH